MDVSSGTYKFFSLLIFFLSGLLSIGTSYGNDYEARLSISFIPEIKSYEQPGRLSISKEVLSFLPDDQFLFKRIDIEIDRIQTLELNNAVLKSKDLIVYVDNEIFKFRIMKPDAAITAFFKKFNTMNPTNYARQAFLFKRTFFLLPLFDYSFAGTFELEHESVVFKPKTNERLLKEIRIPFSDVEKIKATGYWLFLLRNKLVIKTEEKTYKFLMGNPKKSKDLLMDELSKIVVE